MQLKPCAPYQQWWLACTQNMHLKYACGGMVRTQPISWLTALTIPHGLVCRCWQWYEAVDSEFFQWKESGFGVLEDDELHLIIDGVCWQAEGSFHS